MPQDEFRIFLSAVSSATGLNNLALLVRALAIMEASYGPDHPSVATGLNNLAELPQATNRLSEAEPLCRRALAILARFTLATGHQHPNLETAHFNYIRVLRELGRSKSEIVAAVKSVLENGPQPPP